MAILLLPGQSLEPNLQRAKDMIEAIRDTFPGEQVDYLHYAHRTEQEHAEDEARVNNQPAPLREWRIDMDNEQERLSERVNMQRAPYGIIAKSTGALLFLDYLRQLRVKPERVLLCGIPLDYATHNGLFLDSLLGNAPDNHRQYVCVQHTDDPTGAAIDFRPIISQYSKWIFESIPGDTHDYSPEELLPLRPRL